MKKWIAILLAMSAVLALPSCGSKDETNEGDGDNSGNGSTGGKKGPYTFVEQEVKLFRSDDKTTVFVNGKALETTINDYASVAQSSLDNTVSLIRVDSEDYYLLNGTELTRIADSEDWSDVMLSASGTGIAYTIKDGWYDSTLYLYDVGSNTTKEVAFSDNFIECTDLAPDGKSLTYVARLEEDEYVRSGYFFDGEKSVNLGASVTPRGLTNGGASIYATASDEDGETALYLYNANGEMKNKIGEYDGYYSLIFNKDHSQMLYSNSGNTYISVNGAAGVKFFKDSDITPVLPDDTQRCATDYSRTYAANDFYNGLFYNDSDIYQVKANYDDTVKLASKVDEYTLSEDGTKIYYLTYDRELRMIMTSWGEDAPEKAVLISDYVYAYDYAITSNCKRVYYLDGDDLYSVNGTSGESRKEIAADVRRVWLGKGDIVYFRTYDYELYACSDGESAKKVLSDLDDVETGYLGYCYFTTDDGEVYCSSGSEKPEKIFVFD